MNFNIVQIKAKKQNNAIGQRARIFKNNWLVILVRFKGWFFNFIGNFIFYLEKIVKFNSNLVSNL